MKLVRSNFIDEMKSFAKNHQMLCVLTLGLAVVGYALGNLAGRAVTWLSECFGTTKKTDSVARAIIPGKELNPELDSTKESLRVLNVFKAELNSAENFLNCSSQERKHYLEVMKQMEAGILNEIPSPPELLKFVDDLIPCINAWDWMSENNSRSEVNDKVLYEKIQKIAIQMIPLMENRLDSLAQ